MRTVFDRPPRGKEIVRIVAHELRTPLTSIQATIQLVLAGVIGSVSAEQKQMLGLALDNVQRMGRLLNDLLDAGKIQEGRLSLRRERLDLAALLQRLVDSFQPLAGERHLRLACEFPGPLRPIFLDRDRVLQIFTNLIHNAIKFTPSGTVTISAADHGTEIECRVSDTGTGIAEKDLPRLFNEFQQLGQASQTGEKGTGLGLALTRQLIELHGGRIAAASRPGHGTTFTFTLPRPHPETLFSDEVGRRVLMASASGRALTLIRLTIADWNQTQAALGTDAAEGILHHFDVMIQTCLREPDDLVIQTEPGQWLLCAAMTLEESRRISERIQQSFEQNSLHALAFTPLVLEFKHAAYPAGGQNAAALLRGLTIK